MVVGRRLDRLIEWLTRPPVRRIRRWSFVATVPVSVLVAHVYGVHQGVAVVAGRLGLSGSVAIAAWRLGGDRGDALRDLLMHPRLRASPRAEFDVLTSLPRLLLTRVARTDQAGLTYKRGTFGLALALAFTPVIVTEALVVHLRLGRMGARRPACLHADLAVGFCLGTVLLSPPGGSADGGHARRPDVPGGGATLGDRGCYRIPRACARPAWPGQAR